MDAKCILYTYMGPLGGLMAVGKKEKPQGFEARIPYDALVNFSGSFSLNSHSSPRYNPLYNPPVRSLDYSSCEHAEILM